MKVDLIPRLLAVLLAAIPMAAAQAEPVVTESGGVEGVSDRGVLAFKAIPYAAPPVGDLRWRPPAPPASWEGVRKADAFGPVCPQKGAYPEVSLPQPMSEDCLTLNIWRPSDPNGAPLPVMVWIHGGGLVNGSGSAPVYDGAALARRGVLVVTVNYRLGALGFLAHRDLDAEAKDGRSGNYGLLDQIAALSWVRRNIGAFGGDADNVTIFGQSSGAMSVSMLIASPKAKGLFRRAIGESGGVFEPVEFDSRFSPAGAAAAGARFVQRAGAASIAALRSKPAEALVDIDFNPQFVIDGRTLPASPHDAYQAGTVNKADVLVGSNADEGRYFLGDEPIGAANFEKFLTRQFPGWLVRFVGTGRVRNDEEAQAEASAFNGDMRFNWNMWSWARYAVKNGGGKVYYYAFATAPSFSEGHPYHALGATHGMEMPYVFGTFDAWGAKATDQDRALSATLQTYWTNFAKTGDPNGGDLPEWRPFRPSDRDVMTLGETIGAAGIRDLGRLQRIDAVYATARFAAHKPYAAGGVALAAVVTLLILLAWALRRILRRNW